MNKIKSKYSAFSLVEAMIILVLVSVAVMALIPLITQKTTIPKWKINTTNGNTGIFYGDGPNDRVGLNGINPYEKGAKLALNNLAVNTTSSQNSIVLGSRFENSTYINSGNIPNGSVRIGMNINNSCTKANAIIIGSNITNCNIDINIGNRIIKKDKTTAISNKDISDVNAEKAIVYLSSSGEGENGKDTFRFNYPNSTENTPDLAMKYDSGILDINKGLNVNGDIYLSKYKVSNEATQKNDLSADSTAKNNLHCDTDTENNCSEYISGSPQYRDENLHYTFRSTAENDLQWGLTTSDRRLKNVVAPYTKGIEDISKVNTYSFTYKNDKKQKTYVGIIAQKLIGLFDIALHKDSNGYYSYEKAPLLYALTNSVKEINDKQNKIEQKQKEAAKEADRLIKMYK